MPKDQNGLSPGEQLVAHGALVMRFENEQMSAVAVARPRDEMAVKEKALAILARDPDAADAAYYSIPYKEHTREGSCTGQADDPCPVKEEVEGVGIDGARELARLWGNNASRVYFVEEDDEWVRFSGVFVDLETNTRVEVPLGVSKLGIRRGGGVYTLNPQRLAMAVQAGVSKCARNAIVQGLPRWLSRAYYQRAKELVTQTGAVDVPKLVEAFATYGISRERLERFYGERLEDLPAEKRRNLRGLFTALREHLIDPEQFDAGAGGGGRGPTLDGTGGGPQSNGVRPPSPATGARAEVRGGTVAPGPAGPPVSGEAQRRAEEQEEAEEPPLPNEERTVGTVATGERAASEPVEPSPSTPQRVDSPKPNDRAEPRQTDFDGLGI